MQAPDQAPRMDRDGEVKQVVGAVAPERVGSAEGEAEPVAAAVVQPASTGVQEKPAVRPRVDAARGKETAGSGESVQEETRLLMAAQAALRDGRTMIRPVPDHCCRTEIASYELPDVAQSQGSSGARFVLSAVADIRRIPRARRDLTSRSASQIAPNTLELHQDRGAPMTARTFAQTCADLGITRSSPGHVSPTTTHSPSPISRRSKISPTSPAVLTTSNTRRTTAAILSPGTAKRGAPLPELILRRPPGTTGHACPLRASSRPPASRDRVVQGGHVVVDVDAGIGRVLRCAWPIVL